MNIEVYNDILVRASSRKDSWNGYICDYCRFERPWAQDLTQPILNGNAVSWEDAEKFLKEKEYALILTPSLTNEEIAFFKELAERRGIPIGSTVDGGTSTATLEDIRNAKRVLLKANVEKYPLLKVLLKGKEIVEEGYEVAIIEGPAEPMDVPTLILHDGVNAMGLTKAGITGIPEAGAYVIIGNPPTISKLKGEYLILPSGLWAEKEGTVTNAFGIELKVRKARKAQYDVKSLFNF